MTNWCTTYNDLCNEIDILEIREDEIKAQLSRVKQQMERNYAPASKLVASYSGMPGSGFAMMPFDQICGNILALEQELEDIRDVLSLKREARERMEDKMSNFDDLSQRVMVMRDIQRMPLHNIAKELGYSDSYIRKVSMRTTKRKFKVNVKQGTIREHIS